jgi:hypothetical protein
MDNFDAKPIRRSPRQNPAREYTPPPAEIPRIEEKSSRFNGIRKQWVVGFLVFAASLCALWYWNAFPFSYFTGAGDYQAVFLANGQVYFGKLSRQNSKFPVLRDVFYLQVTQPASQTRPGELPSTNINLVKLGSELHAPTDEMRINSNQILFVEDLQSESGVLKAIQNFAR